MDVIDDMNGRIVHHRSSVVRYAIRFCGCIHDAEDLVQEAACKGLATGKLATAANPAGWLRTAVRTTFIDGYRHRRRRPAGPLTRDVPDPRSQRSSDDDLEEERRDDRAARELDRVAALLTPGERLILDTCRTHSLDLGDHRAIAEHLGMKPNTVTKTVGRMLHRLRTQCPRLQRGPRLQPGLEELGPR